MSADGAELSVSVRSALVTGAGSGIRRAVAQLLVSDEATYEDGHALVVDGGLASSLPVSRLPSLGETVF